MASRLAQLLASMQASIAAGWAAAGYTSTVSFERGAKHLDDDGAPPRVVWVRTNDPFSAAVLLDYDPPRRLTVSAGVDAHLWGADDEQAELLRDLVALAAFGVAEGSVQLSAADWSEPDWLEHGAACRIPMSFAQPICDPGDDTVTITAVEEDPDGAVQGDGVIEFGDT